MTDRPPVHLVRGDDPVLLDDAVRALVDELIGDGDRSLVLEELGAADYAGETGGDPDIGPLVNAVQTPPFLGDLRVVVARHGGLFTRAELVAPLVEHLGDPLPTTTLVLVWERGPGQSRLGAVPKALRTALEAAGGVEHDAAAPRGKERTSFLDERASEAGLRLDRDARSAVLEHVGEDLGRLGGILETLASVYGPGARLGVEDVAPYLAEESDLAPWDLTDALDAGDIALALTRLQRMLGAGRHPMALMSTLHRHYGQLLRLDGADATSPAEAAELLGIRPGYPAKKALALSRRLSSEQVRTAIELLATADLDLRGAKPAEYPVMEVLVARLASRCSPRGR